MKLPDTKDPNQLNAYKKGYRLALDQKDSSFMPGTIRRHPELANYFHDGYQQAQIAQQTVAAIAEQSKWRKRFVWILIMLLGGLATGASIINDFEKSQQALQDKTKQTTDIDNKTTDQNVLSILSQQQRDDLILSRQERRLQAVDIHSAVYNQLKFSQATLMNTEATLIAWQTTIPKKTKKLQFQAFTNIKLDELRIQWVFKDQLIKQETILPVQDDKNKLKITSNIQLASRWAGRWTIQIINASNNVIYRNHFNYIKNENP